MELSAPDINVKAVTPASIVMMQKIRSRVVEAERSPYPTVDVVVTIK